MLKIKNNTDLIMKYINSLNEFDEEIQEEKLTRKFLCVFGYNNRSSFWKSFYDKNKSMSIGVLLKKIVGL